MMDSPSFERNRRIARLLHDLGRAVRDGVLKGRTNRNEWETVDRVSPSDVIYQVDRIGETSLMDWFVGNWPEDLPVDIIAEGLGDEKGERFPRNAPHGLLTLLIDPIDGTRGLMHDKRSAWVLAGAAWNPKQGLPRLEHLAAGAMVEIPVTRQSASDSACGWLDPSGAFQGEAARETIPEGRPENLFLRSSGATDLLHGFGTFVSYFPEGREETARIEKEFLKRHLPSGNATPLVFTDQYISSGGQIFELLSGRDRMVADLRPLVFRKLGLDSALTCHPYDLACLPAAKASGCVFEDPWGRPITSPIDTTSPVAWVGYANEALAQNLRPLLREALVDCGYPARD